MSNLPEIVTDQRRLEELCDAWRAARRFAFDTEFIRDDTYDATLCLVQVATADGEVVLIDPLAGLDVVPFWNLVTDDDVLTIVHAGKEDFEVCYRATGRTPRSVFDVQIAAGFAGVGYPLSLARLLDYVLHCRLAKGQTLTDWARRPLTEQQLHYAVEDVAHLPALHARLAERIEKLGRTLWAADEFRRFQNPEYYKPPATDRLFKLKGSKRLDGKGLAVLARLVEWRDEYARSKNRPTRFLVRDDILVEIARRRPTDAADLHVLRGFPQSRNPRVAAEVLEAVARGEAAPRSEWPSVYEAREETPMMRVMLDLLSAVTQAICFEESLSRELVGSAQRLRELIDYQSGTLAEKPPLLLGWRDEFIGRRLMDLMSGRCELHLSGWPEKPRLEVITHGRAAEAAGADAPLGARKAESARTGAKRTGRRTERAASGAKDKRRDAERAGSDAKRAG